MVLTALASWGIFSPLLASASIFSFLSGLATPSQASATRLNSQTLPLLTPATNIDPTPSVGGGDIAVVAGTALLPQDGPDGTLSDIIDRPSSSAISVYVVHKGDTLSSIAKMFDVSVNTIVWANDIKGGIIREGQELVILPITGLRVTVKKGDTLLSIAKRYKADAGDIAQYNNLAEDAALEVGGVVLIPDGEITVAVQPVPKKSSGSNPLRGTSGPTLSGYYMWPVDGGVRTQGLHGYNGVDIGAPRGTSVFASAGGTVIVARASGYNGGYGSYVVIQHDNGTQTLYAHLSRVSVSQGQRIAQGAVIGGVGSTGKSTGNHLHFEVRGAANPFSR